MKKSLLIYLDPGFLDNVGHYINFAENLHEEAKRRDVEVWHFVNRDVSSEYVRRFHLEKVFQYKAALSDAIGKDVVTYSVMRVAVISSIKKMLDPLRATIKRKKIHFPVSYPSVLERQPIIKTEQENVLEAFAATLEMILDRLIAKSYHGVNVSLFMYTSHPLYFPIIARVLQAEKYAPFNITPHVCLFYLNNSFCNKKRSPQYKNLLRSVASLLEWYDPKHKIKLYSDSARVIKRYRKFFRRPIDVLPIPLADDVHNVRAGDQLSKPKKVTIGFFGYAHEKQGYHLVKQLYDNLVSKKEYEHVQFIVRHNRQFLTPEMKGLSDEFIRSTTSIKHLVDHLPSATYESLIAGCDVIVIPHSKTEYPCQTSGLFVDCLKKGKVVVVPSDTWMSDQLKQYGSGKTYFSENFESFTSAVQHVIDHIEAYKSNAARNIGEFSAFHSVENLFNTLYIGERTHAVSSYQPRVLMKDITPARVSAPRQVVMDTNLSKFKNIHRYQRCFVMGNGPSLNKMDLNRLEGEYVFCSNAIFLLFSRIKWRPQYYTCVDTRVLPDRAKGIIAMHEENPDMVCFFPKAITNHQTGEVTPTETIIPPALNRLYFEQKILMPEWKPWLDELPFSAFSLDADKYLMQPYTVSITALQLAVMMGFDPIYLVGCDTNYTVPTSVQQEGENTQQGKMFFTSTKDDDPNHFSPDYFGKDRKWHNPQVENMIWHYKMAYEAAGVYGRHIYNATVGGKLEVFPRVNFDELF